MRKEIAIFNKTKDTSETAQYKMNAMQCDYIHHRETATTVCDQ